MSEHPKKRPEEESRPSERSDGSVLKLDNLSVAYRGVGEQSQAVQKVDLVLRAGESLCLVGSSGAGKSTILSAILGLLPPSAFTEGKVQLPGGPAHSGIDRSDLMLYRRQCVGTVFQNPIGSLAPGVPVLRQVTMAYQVRHGIRKAEAEREARRALQSVGLPDVGHTYRATPAQLSGGMCQRAAVALALSAPRLRLILADEPTSSLDSVMAAQILDLILELQAQHDAALVFITHDIRLHKRFGHVGVLSGGKLVELQSASTFEGAPRSDEGERLVAASRKLGMPAA